MRSFFWGIGILIAVTACQLGSQTATEHAEQPIDTLVIGSQTLYVYPAQESDAATVKFQPARADESEIMGSEPLVARHEDSLIFTLDGKPPVALVNSPTEGEDFVSYDFQGSFDDLGFWAVAISYYEGSGYLLVDQQSGGQTLVWGAPVASPNKQWLACSSADLVAAFDPNGLQLLKKNGGKWEMVGELNLEKWGPESVGWLDDHTLLIRQQRMNENMEPTYQYVKAKMVK
jgi:hypothetical protein